MLIINFLIQHELCRDRYVWLGGLYFYLSFATTVLDIETAELIVSLAHNSQEYFKVCIWEFVISHFMKDNKLLINKPSY